MIKKEFILDGLDCAVCGEKIRQKAQNISNVSNADLNLVTNKLTLTFNDDSLYSDKDYELYKQKLESIVNQLEPDVCVLDYSKNVNASSKSPDDLHEHEHEHDDDDNFIVARMIVSAILLIIALAVPMPYAAATIVAAAGYLIVGYKILIKAGRNILKGDFFDECFLMSVASLGAFIIGNHEEAVGVMLFYNVGEYFNDMAVSKSRKSITELMDLNPDYVNIMRDGNLVQVNPDEISIGDTIIVKTGERIPIDGIVKKGASSLDTLAITGESVPKDVKEGDAVISGCINQQGVLEIVTTTDFSQSTVSKILELTENAQSKKAKVESFITKFSKVYTPAVVISALMLAVIPSIITANPSVWIYRALTFLVVSCPCALVLSIPLTYFNAIGGASANGVLVKGGSVLDLLSKTNTIAFDKTGTLTKGRLHVGEIKSYNSISHDELIEYAAYAEAFSTHPIAAAIREKYGRQIDFDKVQVEEIAGKGLKAFYNGKEILCGKKSLMDDYSISADPWAAQSTLVYVAADRTLIGIISLSDEIKDNVNHFISDIKKNGIQKTVMLTGDNKNTAEQIANAIGIDEVHSELLPEDKVNEFESIMNPQTTSAYVGDGINDAPVLARADVGIAMGGLGSDAAIEAADVVIMNDDVTKIKYILKLASKTRLLVIQNITLSLGIKFLVLGLSAFGIANMWLAVFADVGVSLLAILNSLRARYMK